MKLNDLYSYFLISIFLEIFKENPIAIKWITAPVIAPNIKLSNKTQTITNATSEGTVIIIEITVPLSIISRFVSFIDFSLSGNDRILKNGNKNQRLVR